MALKSGLTLLTYNTLGGTAAPTIVPYVHELDAIGFSTVAPGGCGDLTAKLKLPSVRQPLPNLSLLSRVALQSPRAPLALPHFTVWQGEITDPELGLSETDGEYVNLQALGMGNALRDDPRDDAYTTQTIAAMIAQQMSSRSAYLAIDQDTSGIVPRTSSTFSPQFAGTNIEEVVTQLGLLDGDDMWGVWPHNVNRDAANLPTAQLLFHARDTATLAYSALDADIVSQRIMPSAQRAYNAVRIWYNDPASSPPVNFAWAYDTRLAFSGASSGSNGLGTPAPAITGQGTHPWRVRVFRRDYSGVASLTASLALGLAQQYLTLFQNQTNRIELMLRGVRDGSGNPIPLHTVWADRNIYVPSLAVRGTPLPAGPVAGVNTFYIVEAHYEETSAGDQQVTLQCDNYVDTVAIQVARLQLEADTQLRQGLRTTGTVQALGAPLKGWATIAQYANAAAQAVSLAGTSYGVTLAQAPTSITFQAPAFSGNNGGAGANTIGVYGFNGFVSATAAGVVSYGGTYQTVGN